MKISVSPQVKCPVCHGGQTMRAERVPTSGKWKGWQISSLGPCDNCVGTGLDPIPWSELFRNARLR